MPKASFAIGTMRRPSASVTSRRASGMDRPEVYQNRRPVRGQDDLDTEDVVLVAEEQRRQQGQDQHDQWDDPAAAPPDFHRLAHRIGSPGAAAITDDGLVGD